MRCSRLAASDGSHSKHGTGAAGDASDDQQVTTTGFSSETMSNSQRCNDQETYIDNQCPTPPSAVSALLQQT